MLYIGLPDLFMLKLEVCNLLTTFTIFHPHLATITLLCCYDLVFFVDYTYKWNHAVFVFHCLTYFKSFFLYLGSSGG